MGVVVERNILFHIGDEPEAPCALVERQNSVCAHVRQNFMPKQVILLAEEENERVHNICKNR